MKLLVVSSWCPYPPDNGSKLRAFSLLRELAKHHDVTLLSFTETSEAAVPETLSGLCRAVTMVPGNPFKPRLPLGRPALIGRIPRSYALTYSARMQELVDVQSGEHDAAIGLQVGAALYLRKKPVCPRVFEEAEVGVLVDRFRRETSPVRRLRHGATWLKYSRFIKGLVNDCERTTVVSEIERDHLARTGCDISKVAVVSNGTDLPKALLTKTKRQATLIYPGSVTYSANLDAVRYFLSEIWPSIRQAVPEAQLVVTGSTDGVTLEELPNRQCVTFTGNVTILDELIAESTACVVPLRLGGGTRLKILQAMALGTPVVSTPKGAEGLAVRDETDILIAGTPEQFTSQVLRLFRDRSLQDALAASGRATVERSYTWTAIGEQLEGVVQEAVATFRRVHA